MRVPVYNDASVIGTLTAEPWNGTTGGVLSFVCNGTLTLNADIDVSGKGYRVGAVLSSPFFECDDQDFQVQIGHGGYKGGSVANAASGLECGRGKWAGGGGGALGGPGGKGAEFNEGTLEVHDVLGRVLRSKPLDWGCVELPHRRHKVRMSSSWQHQTAGSFTTSSLTDENRLKQQRVMST